MKIRITIMLGALLAVSIVLTGCCALVGETIDMTRLGAGEEKLFPLEDVTGVELATIGDLDITLGEAPELRVNASQQVLDVLDVRVTKGLLRITLKPGTSLRNPGPVRYSLIVPSLDTIIVSSVGDVRAPVLSGEHIALLVHSTGKLTTGLLDCTTAEIRVSSTGSVDVLGLSARRLEATLSSVGDVTIRGGVVTEQDVAVRSTGDYDAGDLDSETARVRLTSLGSATIRVSGYLDATLTSMGDLRYYGSPRINQTVTSMGRISRMGD